MLKALLKNISSFFRLSSRENINFKPFERYYDKIEEILKLLKPVLDAIIVSEISSNEMLQKAFSGLSQSVDELTELFENWHPLLSKIYFVLQVESYIVKARNCGVDIFELLESSDECLPAGFSSSSLEDLAQKIKRTGFDQISVIITKAIRDQGEGSEPSSDIITKISDSLSLKSNQEILIEAVALEKLKENAEQSDKNGDLEYIDEMISLVTYMHDRHISIMQTQNPTPVPIPADFCCPLSLELMKDPVIVSSGQTYERVFIRQWIDLGVTVCPKTRQILSRTNLIPNYTVKALIANWCESNNVKLPETVKTNVDPVVVVQEPLLTSSDSTRSHGSPSNNSNFISHPRSSSEESLSDERLDTNEGHNRSNSVSSTVSNANSGDASSDSRQPALLVSATAAPTRSRSQTIWRRPSERFIPRIISSPSIETRADLSGVEAQVKKLVDDLKGDDLDAKRDATSELRLLAKHNMDNRIVIANCGAITLLVELLRSEDPKIQENAVTALLNLSINDINKTAIANADAIGPLIEVLESGTPEAKENSAATLFSLSVIEENKIRIGRSGAVKPLVELLGYGTPRGKRDAATALFNLSIFHENKARIVQAGAVKYLVELMDPAAGMVDKAVAVLSNLATIPEGRAAIGQEGGIPVLVEVVELGSARGKENAAAALLQLCTNSSRFCNTVLQEGAVPPLVALSQSGTPRAKEKAQALLSYFRNQRHGNAGRS